MCISFNFTVYGLYLEMCQCLRTSLLLYNAVFENLIKYNINDPKTAS